MIYANLLRSVVVASAVIVTVSVQAETQVSSAHQGKRPVEDLALSVLLHDGTLVGSRGASVYAIRPGASEDLLHTFDASCTGGPTIGEVECFDVQIQEIYAAGDYVYVFAQPSHQGLKIRLSDPVELTEFSDHYGFDYNRNSIASNGCLFGGAGEPLVQAAIWCHDFASPTLFGTTSATEWSTVTAFDPDSGLLGITAGSVELLGNGGYVGQAFHAFVESTIDGSRLQLTFSDNPLQGSNKVLAVKSTAFNADRPGAFTAVIFDLEQRVLSLKVWNADRAPDATRWAGETIELGRGIVSGPMIWRGDTGLVSLTERFVVFFTTTNGCEVLSFDGARTDLRQELPNGDISAYCRGARERARSIDVLTNEGIYNYRVKRTEISDLTQAESADIIVDLRQCDERRLATRANFERTARSAGKPWRQIKLPSIATGCKKRTARRYSLSKRALTRHSNRLRYEGVAGDDAAWVAAVPAAMREAIVSLESCVGTFASTDEKKIWRCAKQIGKSDESGIGALDTYGLFHWISTKGYPKSY